VYLASSSIHLLVLIQRSSLPLPLDSITFVLVSCQLVQFVMLPIPSAAVDVPPTLNAVPQLEPTVPLMVQPHVPVVSIVMLMDLAELVHPTLTVLEMVVRLLTKHNVPTESVLMPSSVMVILDKEHLFLALPLLCLTVTTTDLVLDVPSMETADLLI